jgi:hypothetical protein
MYAFCELPAERQNPTGMPVSFRIDSTRMLGMA